MTSKNAPNEKLTDKQESAALEHRILKTGHLKDVSLQISKQEDLIVSEIRYRRLFESAKDGILILDAETGMIVDVNPFLIDLLGYSKESFVEKKIWEIGSFRDIFANFEKFLELQQKKYVRYENLPLETAKGKRVNVEFVSNVYIENSKNVIQCNIRDITDRKHNEEELHKLSQALIQSPVSIIITDMRGRIEFANSITFEISGYNPAELIGKDVKELYSQELAEGEMNRIWTTLTAGNIWQGELLHTKKNGGQVWERINLSSIVNQSGVITNFLVITMDISLNRMLIDDLMAANKKANEMNKVKSNFFANMSHELRTPLIGVLGFSEILEDELAGNSDLAKMAQTIRASGQRLMRTLNFILDSAKLESSKTQINLQEINIVAQLHEITELYKSVAEKKKLVYTFSTAQEEIICTIDPALFASIFDNLINNALKFTDKGSVSVILSIENDRAVIKVIDTGIGIAVEEQDHVWEEFRQASEGLGRHYEGTGLGLTISKKYSELMGGYISMYGKPGLGSTFVVSFPLTNIETNLNNEAGANNIKRYKSTHNHQDINILYVEDDEVSANFVSLLLQGHYNLNIAKNGREAIRMAKEKSYHAILMDINLGHDMNGLTTSEKIRAIEGYKDIPIIACTAYAMQNEKDDFLLHGLKHYISKPFTGYELLSTLDNVLHYS